MRAFDAQGPSTVDRMAYARSLQDLNLVLSTETDACGKEVAKMLGARDCTYVAQGKNANDASCRVKIEAIAGSQLLWSDIRCKVRFQSLSAPS